MAKDVLTDQCGRPVAVAPDEPVVVVVVAEVLEGLVEVVEAGEGVDGPAPLGGGVSPGVPSGGAGGG